MEASARPPTMRRISFARALIRGTYSRLVRPRNDPNVMILRSRDEPG
jgi:hypothetical protein